MAQHQRTMATEGAFLSYQEVLAAGPPRDPGPEGFQATIFRGERNKEALVFPPDGGNPQVGPLFLMRSENPKQAYNLYGKPSLLLDKSPRPRGWGEIFFACVYPRVSPSRDEEVLKFRMPGLHEVQRVAIKKLYKPAVQWYLEQGGRENPFKEIARMQEFGDGVHVLNCVDALEDEHFLYIITPYSTEGSLAERLALVWEAGMPEAAAQALFKNILEILLYLERHGIFHHDLSPDNFLFFNGRLLLFDFAMSLKIPRDADGQQRYLINPTGVYGTPPCHSPEMYANRACDGVFCDLWGAATILYALLTGHLLYRVPHPTDILFRYYILVDGLEPEMNERAMEVLQETFDPSEGMDVDRQDLLSHAMANLNLSNDARNLLINLLKFRAQERWSLIQAVQSPWVQSNLG